MRAGFDTSPMVLPDMGFIHLFGPRMLVLAQGKWQNIEKPGLVIGRGIAIYSHSIT